MAAVLGAVMVRCALAQEVPDDSWVVMRMADGVHGDVVHAGSAEECGLWVAQAPSGFVYLIARMGEMKGVAK